MSESRPQCTYCGCTEEKPCRHSRFITCRIIYVNPRAVCSSRECVGKEVDRLFAEIDERQHKVENSFCP
jgi:hypothetical protein